MKTTLCALVGLRSLVIIWVGLFIQGCATQSTPQPNEPEIFIVPKDYETAGLRFDEKQFVFSLPPSSVAKFKDVTYNSVSMKFKLENESTPHITELYYALSRNDEENTLAQLLDVLFAEVQQQCPSPETSQVPVNTKSISQLHQKRYTYYCYTPNFKTIFNVESKVVEHEGYFAVIQLKTIGDHTMTDAELELMTNVMVFTKLLPTNTRVRSVYLDE